MDKMAFELGRLVMTMGVADKIDEDPIFGLFVVKSLERYKQCDWGDTCEEDKKSNDDDLKNDGRILAVYIQPETETTIWIITEWDRSVTTILFPHEY